jgi:NAD-dependent deacetylase
VSVADAVRLLKRAKKVTALTGAGVSAESSVPTFRGEGGLWKKFRAEELATPEAFQRDPALVWEWYGYRQKIVEGCRPNPAHQFLAKMENYFEDFCLVTQNVDGLHRKAGSRRILELHGSLFQARCTGEGRVLEFSLGEDPLPRCPRCGAMLRPNVVWFGESLDGDILDEAMARSLDCDAFIVAGTSALVQPAASLPVMAKRGGAGVIEVNLDATPLSRMVDVSIRGKAGEILPLIWEGLSKKNE